MEYEVKYNAVAQEVIKTVWVLMRKESEERGIELTDEICAAVLERIGYVQARLINKLIANTDTEAGYLDLKKKIQMELDRFAAANGELSFYEKDELDSFLREAYADSEKENF